MKTCKLVKKLIAFSTAAMAIFSFSSCFSKKDNHEHAWQYYVVRVPFCEKTGVLEKICTACGQKVYEEIEANGHMYADGKCTVCGVTGSSGNELVRIPVPEGADNSGAWSMHKIYETGVSVGYQHNYQTFIGHLSNGWMQDIYLDQVGLLHTTTIYDSTYGKGESWAEIPLAVAWGRVSPENPTTTQLSQVYQVEFKDDEMLITYSDGLQISAGKSITNNMEEYIIGFGINKNNEFVIYYGDGTIAFAGKLAVGETPPNQSGFTYQIEEYGYTIVGVHINDDVVKVPISHRGKPILAVESFYGITDESIVLPKGVHLTVSALRGLSPSATLYLEGKKSDYYPFWEFPFACYEEGEWTYVDGVPTPTII